MIANDIMHKSIVMWSATFLRLFVLVLVMSGLTLALLFHARSVSARHVHNAATFQKLDGIDPASSLYTAWRPRIASLELSYQFVQCTDAVLRLAGSELPYAKHLQYAIALWTAGWFVAICIVYMFFFRMHSLFYMFGTFAGIVFGYMPSLDYRIYSWDMPALFFFVLIAAMLSTLRMRLVHIVSIVALILIAIPFKETATVFCLFPFVFMRKLNLMRRGLVVCSIVFMAIGLKAITSYYVSGAFFSFSTEPTDADGSLLVYNLKLFFHEPIFLANAGTLFAMFVAPVWRRDVIFFKVVAVAFVMGNILFGVIDEYRIWFELIPLSLITLHATMGMRSQGKCKETIQRC